MTITTPAQMREASIYYIDCEFDGHSGPLLSLAMVRGDGYSTHIRVNLDAKDPWVQANVMPIMDSHNADVSETVDLACVGQSIRDFIGTCQHPTIIADSPVDIWRFCAAISTASDGQWSSVDYPKISFAVHNVACYPTTLAGAVQHNAWWDAMALRDTLCRALPVAEPEPQALRVKPLSDEDRDWIDARADELFRANERARGGVRIQTITPQDFRDYFVVTATRERILSQIVAERTVDASETPVCDHQRGLMSESERQAIRDRALDDAAQAASNRAAFFRDAAEIASEAGFHALRAFHAMRELCLVEIAAAIRAMKGKPE